MDITITYEQLLKAFMESMNEILYEWYCDDNSEKVNAIEGLYMLVQKLMETTK